MKHVLTFVLEKPARKGGGDKYSAEGREDFNIYIPQEFSRGGLHEGQPIKKFRVILKTDSTEPKISKEKVDSGWED